MTPSPLWERACSRKRYNIQHLCWLTFRLREQARSHSGFCGVWATYLRATITARIGAGSPSMVLLWSAGSRKSLSD
ncbi:hypothetical protein C0J56_05465 [Pseudomonas fluorescens]|nr:hypothetical protein C0J56_05465 [Pseudomonas fluorescens]